MMKIKMRGFCWFLSLFCAIRTEGFAVRGPAMPLVVQLGASVTLPCSVDTPLPLHELEVQWMREDSATLVHLFQEGESRPESQSPVYSGRADFFSEEISKGNFSLLLRSVTSEDKGLYKCVVHTVHESNETKVTIDIEWLVVTGADLPIFAYAGQDVILNCSVDTHVPLKGLEVEWIKTNGEILVLLFSERENRPESQHERFRGCAKFFSEEIPKGNFSLKLRDVKTEDKGEFMCRVHTDRESGNATVWLRGLGFSSLHTCVLVLTIAAAVFAVLSCIPALRCIITKDVSNRALLLYCLQVSVPCILISIAFAIWGYIEGSVGEAFVGSAINFMRILILFRVAPYIKILHGTRYRRFTYMALPLDNLVITTGVNSVVLQTFLIYRTPGSEAKAVTGILFGIVFLLSLLAVYSGWTRIGPFVFMCQTIIIVMEILLLFTIRGSMFSLTRFILFFLSLGSIIVVAVFHVLKSRLRRTRYGYLCDKVLLVLHFILQIIFSFQFLDLISEKDKERPALMCFIAFLFILTAAASFRCRRNLPAVPHILVYVFGSAVLSVLNSVAIAAEVILKAEKGERTVDLRLIVFPLEFFFLAFWLVLQMYEYCLRRKAKMIKQLELICPCCTTRGQSPASSQQNQTPQELQEMVRLCPPEQSTVHRQGTDDSPSDM